MDPFSLHSYEDIHDFTIILLLGEKMAKPSGVCSRALPLATLLGGHVIVRTDSSEEG